MGGTTYGVAKGVSLHGVRVLSCVGVGFTSDVIAGVDWVTTNHRRPAVANMSLGGASSAALNTAVTSLWSSGVFLAVAAGERQRRRVQLVARRREWGVHGRRV